jgi:hypothetical protein
MSIDEYFHKTLFASTIIIGPALTMTLPFVYWVQYKDMLLFPSLIYYVTATGSMSALLYFFLYVVPGNKVKLKGKNKPPKQILLLPPPKTSKEDSKTTEEPVIVEPIIYNKVEDTSLALSPSVPNTISQAHQEETTKYKRLYLAFIEKYVRKYIPEEDAQIVLENIYLAIDNRTLDLITEGYKHRLPYEVKATSNFSGLNTEDICHIGFVVKFFLKKRNNYGATFIKEVFANQLKDVELSTLEIKLASNESPIKHIPIPEVCWPEHGSLAKKFNGQITEELIQKI